MVQPGTGAYPKAARTIVGQRVDGDVAQACLAGWVVHEPVGQRVVTGQPAGNGADPQAPAFIGMQREDVAIGQRSGVGRVGQVAAEAVAVPPQQAALAAHPQKALAVFSKGVGASGFGRGDVTEDRVGHARPSARVRGSAHRCRQAAGQQRDDAGQRLPDRHRDELDLASPSATQVEWHITIEHPRPPFWIEQAS
jgi:hypothetical protein